MSDNIGEKKKRYVGNISEHASKGQQLFNKG